MYQTRLVKADLSLRVPLALPRHSPLPALTFSLSLSHQASFSTGSLARGILLLSASVKWKNRRIDGLSTHRAHLLDEKIRSLCSRSRSNVGKEKLVEYSSVLSRSGARFSDLLKFSNLRGGQRWIKGKKVRPSWKYCSVTGVGHCATSSILQGRIRASRQLATRWRSNGVLFTETGCLFWGKRQWAGSISFNTFVPAFVPPVQEKIEI